MPPINSGVYSPFTGAGMDSVNAAEGQIKAALMAAPGQFAGAMGNAFAGFGQGIGGLGQAMANMYGSNAGALGNLATARANFAGNQAAANAMAEAARQTSLGNMGVAALGAYGGAANSAMGAWAQNQQGYNRSLADMYMANQNAMAQLGATRNTSLAQLGSPYAQMGIGGALAGALSQPAGGSGGFLATGPSGAIASGQYSRPASGGDIGGGMNGSFAGLNALRGSLDSPAYLDAMRGQVETGANRLDAQHYSSRGMPGQMLGQTLSGLLSLGRQGYDQLRGGMNQFYANRPTYNDSDVLTSINSNFNTARGDMAGLRGDLTAGLSNTQGALRGLFDDSLGNLFPDPMRDARQRRQLELFNRRNQMLDLIEQRRNYATRDGNITGRTYLDFYNEEAARNRLRTMEELYPEYMR